MGKKRERDTEGNRVVYGKGEREEESVKEMERREMLLKKWRRGKRERAY